METCVGNRCSENYNTGHQQLRPITSFGRQSSNSRCGYFSNNSDKTAEKQSTNAQDRFHFTFAGGSKVWETILASPVVGGVGAVTGSPGAVVNEVSFAFGRTNASETKTLRNQYPKNAKYLQFWTPTSYEKETHDNENKNNDACKNRSYDSWTKAA